MLEKKNYFFTIFQNQKIIVRFKKLHIAKNSV